MTTPARNEIEPTYVTAILAELALLEGIEYARRRKAAAKSLGIAVSALDQEIIKRRFVAQGRVPDRLILSASGAVVPILANAVAILRGAATKWKLRYEDFSKRAFLGEKPLEDEDLLIIAEWIQRQGCYAGRRVTDDAILKVAQENRFHIVSDWLEKLPWDGIKRIDSILIDHAEADDTPLTRAFTGKWLIQAVARIIEPGCQADATLVLEGPQGAGKSSLLRVLFGDRWFTDHLPNLDSKDALIQLLGTWCVEISELAAVSGKENAKTKMFLTSRDDRFRLPFDRIAKNHPRSVVFAGTVNPGAAGYLKDETGGRRFWPVKVGHIDLRQIAAGREQYWAEAFHRYLGGEIWHLHPGEVADAAKEQQSHRFVNDPWQEKIAAYVAGREFVLPRDILVDLLQIPLADWSQVIANRISRCLASLDWTRKQRRDVNSKREWVYVPPVTTSESQIPNLDEDVSLHEQD